MPEDLDLWRLHAASARGAKSATSIDPPAATPERSMTIGLSPRLVKKYAVAAPTMPAPVVE
eukprot:366095-Chlamydomonas_euryale.AAC.3